MFIPKRVNFNDKFERYFLVVFCGLVVGSFGVSFIIWNRLLRERFPVDLAVVELYSSTFWFVLIVFCYFFIVVTVDIYHWQKEWRGITKTNKYVLRFAEWADNQPIITNIHYFISHYILSGDKFLWRYLYLNFPYTELKYKYCINYIFNLGLIIHNNIFHVFVPLDVWATKEQFLKKHILTTKLLLYYPRIIAFSAFLSEIVIYKRLYYFYFVAIILLIPLIFLALRRMFLDIAKYEELFLLEEDLIIVDSDENLLRYGFKRKDPSMSDADFVEKMWLYRDMKYLIVMSNLFFEIDRLFGKIYKFITTVLWMLSFLFWLLIILKLY
jgi:hypothetical protein